MKTKKFKIINVIVYAVVFWGLFFGFTPGIQAKLVPIGVLAFHDESGTGIPSELGLRISRDLQQKLVRSYRDLLPRVIGTEMDAAAIKNMSVFQLASYGKQQGVTFLVRGGVLAILTENIGNGVKVSIELYVEVISTGSAKVKSVRAKGVGTQRGTYPYAGIPWEAIDVSGGEFQYSAPGMALINAVEQLAGLVHDAVVSSPQAEETVEPALSQETEQETETPYEPSEETEEYQYPGEEDDTYSYPEDEYDYETEGDSDEELQQLIYQAEELIYNSSISKKQLKSLTKTLEKLKESLNTKVTLMEQGEDTTQVEQDIAEQKETLEQIISQITEEEETYSEEESDDGYEETDSGEKKSLLAGIGQSLDDSLNIIQKIKEIRSTLRGVKEESQEEEDTVAEDEYEEETDTVSEEETDTVSEEGEPEEESGEEVTGVVTEDGEPVEGVEVTDPETGASTTTDSSGFYNLGKIPAGRLSNLVIKKNGKFLASGKVDLVKGRAAVADWELKPKFKKNKAPTMRIMPSAVNVAGAKKFKGKTGTVKGVVLDARGKPMPRTLVKLEGLGTARTNSKGQYVFLKVPPGSHQLTVMKSGLNTKSQVVRTTAKKTSVQKIRFTPTDRIREKTVLPKLISRGAATTLRGMVTDVKRRPVRSAKVTVFQSGRALSVATGITGMYKFKDLKPGKYRVLVSKVGFKSTTGDARLKAGKTKKLNFKLVKSSRYVQNIVGKQRAKQAKVAPVKTIPGRKKIVIPGKKKVVTTAPKIRHVGSKGQLIGRVIDAKTKRPIASAVVYIKGAKAVKTDRYGNYTAGNLSPGSYSVSISKSGYYGQSKKVKIPAKRSTRKDFSLRSKSKVTRVVSKTKPKTKVKTKARTPVLVVPKTKTKTKTTRVIAVRSGQIRGFVTNAKTRKPVAGAAVSIAGRRTTSNRGGSFVSRKLAPGTYRVSVGKSGYSGSTKTVTVRAGKTSTVKFYLSPRASKLRLR